MITYYVLRNGITENLSHIDPEWLRPGSGVMVWADVQVPSADDAVVLRDVFKIHPLAVQDALEWLQHPKVETYPGLLYVVLHGINFRSASDEFDTHDTDFFLTREFLVTVHDGQRRSIEEICRLCLTNMLVMREGTVALMHRIVDRMVDHYRPSVDELEQRLNQIEDSVIEGPSKELTRQILLIKRDISGMRRIVLPQRDVVGRLSRREFEVIDQEMSYRFRDVFDQLVRMADDAIIFQERVTGILDAHLTSVSNQLASVSKVLAALAVILGPLTVITGAFGMNVALPMMPGGERAQFFWIVGGMGVITGLAYYAFRKKGWL
ncbi:MAG TPA: magnesium transporter CorA family protein [Vicinamibacterales bacterium]|nr:magnesium transporter CorA family protein [Vicinamibacterales bacterium]